MKRGERTPIAPFQVPKQIKNAPCVKVSVKLVIINKHVRFCLVLSRISRAAFSQEEKIPLRAGNVASRQCRKNGWSSPRKVCPKKSLPQEKFVIPTGAAASRKQQRSGGTCFLPAQA